MTSETSAQRLRAFFETSAAAHRATKPLKAEAEVRLVFPEEEGKVYRFIVSGERGRVIEGEAKDPDFDLVLPAGAIDEITGLESDNLGEFAVAFFRCMLADEPERKAKVKLHSGFLKLTRRGYLKTLTLGGPTVLMFMAKKGLKGPAGIKRAIDKLRK